ncbi:MAG: glutathione S-transferase [Gammaproteobacteria bacterium]
MTPERLLFLALLVIPIAVAVLNLGWMGAMFLVVLWLLLRWFVTLKGLMARGRDDLQFDTIAASHFVEKVRWCLDRANIPYTEHQSVGTLGAFFTGRSVPRLRVRTGNVTSSVGNSPEILRYLWGRYGHESAEDRAFLKPTPERVDWEKRLDRYGVKLQVWVYFHMIQHPEKLAKVWGLDDPNAPLLQRWFAKLAGPLLRKMIALSFNVNARSVVSAKEHIEKLLTDTEARLAESDFLVGNERSYVDYAFAGLSSLWLLPEQFGNGKSEYVRMAREDVPKELGEDADAWRERFPATVSFLDNLYQNERRNKA